MLLKLAITFHAAVWGFASAAFCPEIESIEHGSVTSDDSPPYEDGAVISFTCDRGYKGTGKGSLTCKDGRWSDPVPYCAATSCRKNLTMVEKKRKCRKPCTGDKDCKRSFKKCLCDGWCGKSCFNPNADCLNLSPPEDGYILKNEISYGHTVTYGYKDGYLLTGPATRVCQSDKKWSGHEPRCAAFSACGQSEFHKNENLPEGKVLQGQDARVGAWPWQAILFYNYQHQFELIYNVDNAFAGGSIIDHNWILTAAHVFKETWKINKNKDPQFHFLIAVGLTRLPGNGETLPEYVDIFEPKIVHIHKKFDSATYDHDVALVKIGKRLIKRGDTFVPDANAEDEKLIFSGYVRPVCLPCMKEEQLRSVDILKHFDHVKCHSKSRSTLPSNVKSGHDVIVTGLGRSVAANSNFRPKTLQEGLLKIADDSRCIDAVKSMESSVANARYSDTMLCTENSVSDACQGDSGGPLVNQVNSNGWNKHWVLVGIVSSGFGCGKAYPGFYTSVTSIMHWVWKVIDNEAVDDVNCNFDGAENPLCGYTNNGKGEWERQFESENTASGDPSYVLKVTSTPAVLRSPVISSSDKHCFKFSYYISRLRTDDSLTINTQNGRMKIGGVWKQEQKLVWQTQQLTIDPLEIFGGIEFEITQENDDADVAFDDFSLRQGACESNCLPSTCSNGICVDRVKDFECLCDRFHRGKNCRTLIICPDLPKLDNGQIEVSSDPSVFKVDTKVKFSCNEGYNLIGIRSIACQPDGKWSETPRTRCREILCPAPPPHRQGFRTIKAKNPRKLSIGTVVTYSCPIGMFLFAKDPIIVCNKLGRWSGGGNGSCLKQTRRSLSSPCPTGYRFEDPMCYRVVEEKTDFVGASSLCSTTGASLAVIRSAEERRRIEQLISRQKLYYVGVTNIGSENYIWADREILSKIASERYRKGFFTREDLNNETNCGVLVKHAVAFLHPLSCARKRSFICQTFSINVLPVEVIVGDPQWDNVKGIYRPILGLQYNEAIVYKLEGDDKYYLFRSESGWTIGGFNVNRTQPLQEKNIANTNSTAKYPQDIVGNWTMGGVDMQGQDASITVVKYDLWTDWTSWGPCSKTCGTGRQEKTRKCLQKDGSPGYGDCLGENTSERNCNTKQCIITRWGNWENWSQCSVPCGGGTKTRERICIKDSESSEFCTGKSFENSTCGTDACKSEWTPCNSNPCGKGGVCKIVDVEKYKCECYDSYRGRNCKVEIKCGISKLRKAFNVTYADSGKIVRWRSVKKGIRIRLDCSQIGQATIDEQIYECIGDNKWNMEPKIKCETACTLPRQYGRNIIVKYEEKVAQEGTIFFLDSLLVFGCPDSMELVGNKTALCTKDGWDVKMNQKCEAAVTCKNLTAPEDGTLEMKKKFRRQCLKSGTTVTLSCEEPYTLTGLSSITCLETGDWSGELGECINQSGCILDLQSLPDGVEALNPTTFHEYKTNVAFEFDQFFSAYCAKAGTLRQVTCAAYTGWIPDVTNLFCN